ncbi:hypothetical protein cyc_07565 [Cyclospora cayetanensis]|uniref:Signal recognition particle 19 kDa protein n=1 Tax=Cyclospora cayetanensis TaxID=88456 RepID=A0A1D3D2H5_9EIME|nr:hypothetical protein cyc_07565 [Cyclospora cayetanensis]
MPRGGQNALPSMAAGSSQGSLGMQLPPGLPPELLSQMFGGAGSPSPLSGLLISGEKEAPEEDDGVDRSRWLILYPAYLNKKYTTAQGRRVGKALAVEDPTIDEMKMICDHLHIPVHVERARRYPRDWLLSVGRLRVQLKTEAGKLHNESITSSAFLWEGGGVAEEADGGDVQPDSQAEDAISAAVDPVK